MNKGQIKQYCYVVQLMRKSNLTKKEKDEITDLSILGISGLTSIRFFGR